MAEDDDVKLSPGDIEKLKQVKGLLDQATGLLNDIPDDVREEYGDLEDAISKVEEASDLVSGCMTDDDAGGSAEASGAAG